MPIALLAELRARRLLAIVRGRDPEAAFRSVMVLVEEGVSLLEVSLSGTDALTVLQRACRSVGGAALLGAGTVRTVEDAERAVDAGVAFLVSPALGEGVVKGLALGLPVLPGALTPTEVLAAWQAGAQAVKVFPASVFGAPYIRALADPFPDIPLVPVGGVGAADIPSYLAAGAVAVGLGSPLLGDAPHGGDLQALRERARQASAALTEAG